jgi:glycosyltransferase involved in cell wall biosynthesis
VAPANASASVAVLIPTHRRPDRLARTLEALDRARGAIAFDVHVADSTPEEDLQREVREACARYDYVSLTRHGEGSALPHKRNFMAREARADLLVDLVDDIYVEEGAIELLVEAYARESGWRIVAGSVGWGDDWTLPVTMRSIGYGRSARPGEAPWFVVGAFLLCPRALALACPYLETTNYYPDQLIGSLWRAKGVKMLYEPRARARHDEEHTVYGPGYEAGRVYANLFDSLVAKPSIARAITWDALGFAAAARKYLRRRETALPFLRAYARGHRKFLRDRPLLRAAVDAPLPAPPP